MKKSREDLVYDLADLYKLFGDSTRLKILYTLFDHEVCVNDIAGELGMTLSAISHQLRLLKQAHLVRGRREGKTIFYALADEHVYTILDMGIAHLTEEDGESFPKNEK